MQFTVPQFIEKEAKILGPFTFKQTLYLVGAGLIIFFLYFSLAKINLLIFIVITVILAGTALSLAFLKIGGYSFSVLLRNSFRFFVSSKIYLWKRVMVSPKVVPKKEKPKIETAPKETALKIAEKSQLKKLSVQIETMTK